MVMQGKRPCQVGRSSCSRIRKGKKRVGEEESLEKEKRGNVKKIVVDKKEEQEGAKRGGRTGEQRGLMIFSRLGPKVSNQSGKARPGCAI